MSDVVIQQDEAKQAKALADKAKYEADICEQYPHAVAGTFQFHPEAGRGGKWSVEIICVDCGERRRVFTSDLFQVKRCLACTKKAKKAKKLARRVVEKAERALAKAGSGVVEPTSVTVEEPVVVQG
jgi:hypothetical protein